MRQPYRHTQVGYPVLALNALLALAFLVGALRPGPGRWGLLAGMAIIVVASALFGALTVEVDARQLRFRFGPGGWGRAVARADIVEVRQSRARWYEGIGIRSTGRGFLYNVSAGAAVEILLRDGKRFRLGTDEPEALVRALAPPGLP